MELTAYLGHIYPSLLLLLLAFYFFLCCIEEKFMSKLTWDSKNFKGILKTVPDLQMGYNSKYHLKVGCLELRTDYFHLAIVYLLVVRFLDIYNSKCN